LGSKPETIGVESNILCIRCRKIAPGKAAVVQRVQQVGFSHAVQPTNSRNPVGEVETNLLVILKLGYN
jgi:hypothetical protein